VPLPDKRGFAAKETVVRRHEGLAISASPDALYVRKPALDLSDVVRQPFTLKPHRRECISGTVAGFARPRQAVKPKAAKAARRRRGLDGESADRAIIMSPQCASSSDTVGEIKYQILHLMG
jgi:hypothetical protein